MIADSPSSTPFRERWISFIHGLQDEICKDLEDADGKATFMEDRWVRAEGGGGKTRVMADGAVFEKGGVNTSVVHGPVTDTMRQQLQIDAASWFACGLSLVIHPFSPMVPTVHANWRYFELYDEAASVIDRWFGGGSDLTPYYLFKEDARHFHTTLKEAIEPFGAELYPRYKKQCDEYFINRHRGGEARGVGGVFYDHVRVTPEFNEGKLLAFQEANGRSFLPAYLPIVQRRKALSFTEEEKYWQEIRRGRYVEFNLIHDRGTIFGLKTNGRTESILMSLPPTVRWAYDYHPQPGSKEAELVEFLQPQDWVNMEL